MIHWVETSQGFLYWSDDGEATVGTSEDRGADLGQGAVGEQRRHEPQQLPELEWLMKPAVGENVALEGRP